MALRVTLTRAAAGIAALCVIAQAATAGRVVSVLFLLSLAIPSFTPGPVGGYFADSPELTNPSR